MFDTRCIQQYSFVETDQEIFVYGHCLPSADSRRAVVSVFFFFFFFFFFGEMMYTSTG